MRFLSNTRIHERQYTAQNKTFLPKPPRGMQTLPQTPTEPLRDWLLHGRLKPGERIEEVPLARTMGVSRTPVRAALATLASEGLIDHQPKRAYLVKEFALADILSAYEV